MKISMSFKNVKHSRETDKQLHEKCYRLDKFLEGQFSVKWHCRYQEGLYVTEVYVHGPKFSFHAGSKDSNLFKAFDSALEKIERQIVKQKEKIKSRRSHHAIEISPDYDAVWDSYSQHKDWDIAS